MLLNAEPKMSTYLHAKGIEKGIPVSGSFELTSRCNFSCKMCYVHDDKCNHKRDSLDAKQWLELGRQAQKAGTLFLLLTGGEPLLRPDFEEIYLGLSELGFMLSINTNASLLDKYLPLFRKAPPMRINASLYAADRENYKTFCGADVFDKVINNLKSTRDAGIDIKLNTVFTRLNCNQMPDIIRLSKDLGLHIKPTAYAYPQVRVNGLFGESPIRLEPTQAAECTLHCERLLFGEDAYLKRTEKITEDCTGRASNSFTCRAGRASFWITSDGIMRACGMLPSLEGYPLTDGFSKAWETVRQQTSAVRMPEECLTCRYADICKVCPAMVYAETGSFSGKPDYICRFSKAIYDIGKG